MILKGETWLVNEYGEKMPVDVQTASLYMGEPLKITVLEKYPHTGNFVADHLRKRSIERCPDILATGGLIQGSIHPFGNDDREFVGVISYNIKRVIFNGPATIVFWADGTKTVVKCQEGDEPSLEHGLAMCIAKKALGNKSNFNNVFHKWIKQ